MGVMDILLPLILLGGVYWLHTTGQLEPLLQGIMPKPPAPGATPSPPTPAPRLAIPAPAPSGGGRGGGGEAGGGGGQTTTSPAPSTGGSAISGGGTCPGGESCKEDGQGRFDCDGPKGTAYEATWCGTFSGDDLTIKMYGPPHSNDGDCCWCVIHVKEDGSMQPGGEGPHPNSNCEHGGGKGAGKAQCYKGVMKPGPIQEGYALIGGKWQLMFSHKGPCGCDKTSTSKTGDQVTFRCDGNFNTTCATVKPLGGGGGAPPPAAELPASGAGEDPAEESNYARSYSAFRTRRRHYYVQR